MKPTAADFTDKQVRDRLKNLSGHLRDLGLIGRCKESAEDIQDVRIVIGNGCAPSIQPLHRTPDTNGRV